MGERRHDARRQTGRRRAREVAAIATALLVVPVAAVLGLKLPLGAGGVLALALSVPEASIPLASIVAAVWGGAGLGVTSIVARAQRTSVAKVQLALEQVLDRLEHDTVERKPGASALIDMLTTAARRVR